jgi:hypothetical protein
VTHLSKRAPTETNGAGVDGEYLLVAVDEVVVVAAAHGF